MIFPGDIESGGWNRVNQYKGGEIDYYCISHHGSKNGICCKRILRDRIDECEVKVLMGRDRAYSGIFCNQVKLDIGNTTYCTDDKAIKFIEVDWENGNIINH